MNILFVTAYDVSPQKGGTERVIHSLSNGLCADFGVKCYLAYYDEIEKHYELLLMERSGLFRESK